MRAVGCARAASFCRRERRATRLANRVWRQHRVVIPQLDVQQRGQRELLNEMIGAGVVAIVPGLVGRWPGVSVEVPASAV